MNKLNINNVTVITSAPHKIREINEILGTKHKVTTRDIPEIQSLNLDKVIKAKVKNAYTIFKKPVLVEDISFELTGLNGLPGTFVKFFIQTLGAEGVAKLIKGKNNEAKAIAAVAIYDGKNLKIFKSEIRGKVISKIRGENGFGFDGLFIPNGSTKTFAQMAIADKNKVSHRGKALNKVKKYLTS